MKIIIEYMQRCHIHLYQKIAREKVAGVNAALSSQNSLLKENLILIFDSICIKKLTKLLKQPSLSLAILT